MYKNQIYLKHKNIQFLYIIYLPYLFFIQKGYKYFKAL